MKKYFFKWRIIKRLQGNDYSIGKNENQYNNSEPKMKKKEKYLIFLYLHQIFIYN